MRSATPSPAPAQGVLPACCRGAPIITEHAARARERADAAYTGI
eukprot:gene54807-2237_t